MIQVLWILPEVSSCLENGFEIERKLLLKLIPIDNFPKTVLLIVDSLGLMSTNKMSFFLFWLALDCVF
jgi:hypothetical protein